MSIDELKHVKDFSIENEHGKIEFLGETDLTEVDLAQSVDIGKLYAEVYDDENSQIEKPPEGQKLNKVSVITLKNVQPGKNPKTRED